MTEINEITQELEDAVWRLMEAGVDPTRILEVVSNAIADADAP